MSDLARIGQDMRNLKTEIDDALMRIDNLEGEVYSVKKENKKLREIIFHLAEDNNLDNPFQ